MNSYRLLTGVFVACLALAACSAGSDGTEGAIKIGFSGPRSGPAAEGGNSIYMGVAAAVENINSGGGIDGRQVELVERDDEGDPTRGVNVIRDLANEEVLAAVGGYLSTVMFAQYPVITQEKFPYIVATANPAPNPDDDYWTFGVRIIAEDTVAYTLEFLKEHFGIENIAVLAEDGGYGQDAVKYMTAGLKETYGIEPATVQYFNVNDKDMMAQVRAARDAGAEAVYLFGIGASNGYVLRDMDRLGWDVPVVGEMGMVETSVAEVAGEASDGAFVVQSALLSEDAENPAEQELITALDSLFEERPTMDSPAAQGYDAMMLLAQAIEDVSLTGDVEKDRQAVRDTLEEGLNEYTGVINSWSLPFSPDDHDALHDESLMMTVWRDGELVLAKKQLSRP